VTLEELTRYVFGAIFLIAIIVAQVRRAAKSMRPADPNAAQQRAAAIQAELARRGLIPPLAPPPVAPQQGSIAPVAQPPHRRAHHQPPPAMGTTSGLGTPVRPVPALLGEPGGGVAQAAGPSPTRRMLRDAFDDPGHARNAVILAEVLGRPVALR
jgi:hypothetical protein